jgi:ABC-2 type transport system ATP-binding protein
MINIQELTFGYVKNDPLFRDFSVQVRSGAITGLLGKNGAGKTTFLKLAAGLLYPQAGRIKVGHHEPRNREPSFLTDIYFVPEEFFLPAISISRFIRANHLFYPRFDHGLIKKLLLEFELNESHSIEKLSYGQKKKFLISFALASRCRLLVLDEPTNGLDIPSKTVFRKVVAGNLEDDQLVLISTHQVRDVESLLDNIILLADGKILLQKDLTEISYNLMFENVIAMDTPDVLYGEATPGGYKVIKRQLNGNSMVDIELLFNAVSKGTKLFNHE